MGIAARAKEEIPYIKGYAAVNFGGEIIDSFGENIEEIVKNTTEIVKNYLKIYEVMGEFSVGLPKEVLMSTTEVFILVRIFQNKNLFQIAILESDGNLGFTRFMLEQYSKEL